MSTSAEVLLPGLGRVEGLQGDLEAGCCEAAGEPVFILPPRQRSRSSLRQDRATSVQHDQHRAAVQHRRLSEPLAPLPPAPGDTLDKFWMRLFLSCDATGTTVSIYYIGG